ncbi:MAG: aminotransferase class IV [Propionicimonas sp.]
MTVSACIFVSPVEASAVVPVAQRLREADPDAPQVSVLDLGVTRGDGIFEVLGVINGRPQAVEAHLRRLAVSAAMLDLAPLDLASIEAAVHRVVELSEPVPEFAIKIVVTRGLEGGDTATCWVIPFNAGDFSRERSEGVRVVLLERGYPHDVAARAPWLLAGAKTLSYAVNKAVLREAARRGADDVLFTSTDGYILEGPTSTLIAKFGSRIWTPTTAQGILRGTTQASAFDFFADAGFATAEVLLRTDQLAEADALWLTSSSRMIVPVRSVDGADIAIDRELTDRALSALLARTH